MRAGGVALAVAAVLLAGSADAETATVTVVDQLSAGQQEESIAVYFAGRLAGTVHIDMAHPQDRFTATIERAPHTPYTLCGRLLKREADGRMAVYPIDNGGVLGDVAGRTLFANTLNDKLFSLEGSEGLGDGVVKPGPVCDAVVASR